MLQAAKDFNIDLQQSYMIGDKISDVLTGERAGLRNSFLFKEGTSMLEIAERIIKDDCDIK